MNVNLMKAELGKANKNFSRAECGECEMKDAAEHWKCKFMSTEHCQCEFMRTAIFWCEFYASWALWMKISWELSTENVSFLKAEYCEYELDKSWAVRIYQNWALKMQI